MTFCNRALGVLPLILCAAGAQANPNLPPMPADPTVASLYSQAQELFTKASASGYMDWPAAGQPWPCEVTDLQVRKLASPLALGDGDHDALAEKAVKAGMRSAGIGTNRIRTTISDVRSVPLAGACKDGKLDGPVEFVVEYTRTTAMSSIDTVQRYRDRTRAIANRGELATAQSRQHAILQISQSTRYADPATAELMKKVPTPKSRHLMAQANQPLNNVAGYMAMVSHVEVSGIAPSWTTTLSQPTGPQTVESYMYQGDKLWTISRVKNLIQHGEQRTFPITMNGHPIPGGMQCFDEGEEIKTTQCDVK